MKKKPIRIYVMLSIFAIIVISTFVYLYLKSQPQQIVYDIVTPSIQTISTKTVATGKIEPRDEVEIKPQISGIINHIYKQAGDKVKKGDVIAQIKIIPEMSSLNQAESNVNIAKIDYNQAQTDFARTEKLYNAKVISAEEFEKERVIYNKARETYQMAKDNLEIIRDGITSRSSQFSNTQIRATIDGMILDIPVKVGNSVIQSNNFNDGTTICTIADMTNMIFKGKIDESEVGRLKTDMPLLLTIGALQELKFNATMEYISPKGVEENGAVLFEIKAAAQIPDSILIRAGYSANAEIILQQHADVLAIPEGVVEVSRDSAYIYILDTTQTTEQIFNRKNVKIGLSDGINIEITDGLKPTDKVRGLARIKK